MIDKVSTEKCCQCDNCINICPADAITFNIEVNGFMYPSINKKKCISCNLCEEICPALNLSFKTFSHNTYIARNKDINILKKSSSGGLFWVFSKTVIEQGGVVYGAAFSKNFLVEHIRVEKIEDLYKLMGSKYVKSKMMGCHNSIKNDLLENKLVLFSGTPCQCAAIKTYLQKYELLDNIIFIDVICHGILSEKLYNEYLSYLTKKNKNTISSISFRDKSFSDSETYFKANFSNGKEICWPYYEDIYLQGMFQGICMRDNCYSCKYKNFKSGSDITLGDFWGAEKLNPKFTSSYGASSLIINSDRGNQLFDLVKTQIETRPMSLDEITKYNQGLIKSFSKGNKYNLYKKISQSIGYFKTLRLLTIDTYIKIKINNMIKKMKVFLWEKNK